VAVSVTFSPETTRRFAGVLDEVMREMGKTLPQALQWASILFLRSCRAATPIAVKQRPIRDSEDPRWRSRLPYQMEVWRQGWTAPEWRGIASASDPKRAVPRRGAARNSWYRAFRDLGSSASLEGTGYGKALSSATKRFQGPAPEVQIDNVVSYMPIIAPNVYDISLGKTVRQFERRLTQQARRVLKG